MDDIKQLTNILPEVGQFVLFAADQHPRIGRVVSINTEAVKPITIHLWKPNKHCGTLDRANFRPSDSESGPDLMLIQGSQIKLVALQLDRIGKFTEQSRKKVYKLLRPIKSTRTEVIPAK